MKTIGLLIPAFSTRRSGDLGIGDTLGMREWVDWAAEYDVGFLQLLPINENGADESPYSGISSIALDPIYLAFEPDVIPCLTRSEIDAARASLGASSASHLVDYPAVRAVKNHLLEISFARFSAKPDPVLALDFRAFKDRSSAWLPDYCLFKLLMEIHGPHLTWDEWPENSRCVKGARALVASQQEKNPEHISLRLDFFAFIQWLCYRQWLELRAYADRSGVKLMGDLPIGVSFHSADVFFNRSEFHTNWFGGTPPEGYSAENPFIHEWGQNWGIPIYDWDSMAQSGFAWWRERLSRLTEIFSIFRIDHILGFYRIYGFPWHPRKNPDFLGLSWQDAEKRTNGRLPRWFSHPDDTPEHKAGNRSNGDFRLRAILDAAGNAEVIAEDLGWVPEYVRPHLDELGISGYRIPHWDSYEDGSPVLGDVFPKHSFATYSTHDHDSLCATWENCRKTILCQKEHPTEHGYWAAQGCAHALRLLAGFSGIPIPPDNVWPPYSDALHWRLVKSLLASNSRYAVLMVTDLFELKDRINTPGTIGNGNWRLRLNLSPHQIAERGRILSALIKISGR
jgi:4-alpha-glucanotransferase